MSPRGRDIRRAWPISLKARCGWPAHEVTGGSAHLAAVRRGEQIAARRLRGLDPHDVNDNEHGEAVGPAVEFP